MKKPHRPRLRRGQSPWLDSVKDRGLTAPEKPRRWWRWLGVSAIGYVARLVVRYPDALLVVLAGIMLSITWPNIGLTHDVPASLQPVLATMTVIPVLMLRRWPLLGWALSVGGAVLWWATIDAVFTAPMPWPVTHFLILLATVFASALWAELRYVPLVVVVTGLLFGFALSEELKVGWIVGQALIVVFGLLIRWLVLSRRQLAQQSEETEVERARRAVVEERTRIARELHDVVAHHMSMIVVQAQSAPVRVADLSPAAQEEFAAIESSARQALNEVRGVLGVLRDQEQQIEVAPQPGLEEMPALLESSRAAGVNVTWHLQLPPQECPTGTALVLHRILQESLTNASRHAPGAPVEVTLAKEEGQAVLTVRNAPPLQLAEEAATETSGGNGITGMQARAEAVGGTLQAIRSSDGGFVVHAVVPLQGRPQLAGLG